MTVLQWNIASGPILDVGQGKNVIDSKQRYRRQKQVARKVKEVSVSREGVLCKLKFNGYADVRVQQGRVVDSSKVD